MARDATSNNQMKLTSGGSLEMARTETAPERRLFVRASFLSRRSQLIWVLGAEVPLIFERRTMSVSYEEYEKACEKIRGEDSKLLAGFEEWLSKKGLSAKVVKGHVSNVDFYINEYLLYEEPMNASEGAYHLNMFLSYWFIKKAAWASTSSIKSNAASLKKFYAYMHERGLISKDALEDVRETIKENMEEYLATLRRYDDPSITDPKDIWGL